jgi:hypothetical protein
MLVSLTPRPIPDSNKRNIVTPTQTMRHAVQAASDHRLESWLHDYLAGEGNNLALSDGLRLVKRRYWGPLGFPLSHLQRCTGPEESMKYRVGVEEFEARVRRIQIAQASGFDLPPLIVNYSARELTINDGNHRFEALSRNQVDRFGIVIWTTGQADLQEFKERFQGEYEPLVF